MLDTVLLPIVITPKIAARMSPPLRSTRPCRDGGEHPSTFRRGAYESHALVDISIYCTVCHRLLAKHRVRPMTEEEAAEEYGDMT